MKTQWTQASEYDEPRQRYSALAKRKAPTVMNTNSIRESISIRGRKIVNVFPGPEPMSWVVATIPKEIDVQFELFTKEECGADSCDDSELDQ